MQWPHFQTINLKIKITVLMLLLFLCSLWLVIYQISSQLEQNLVQLLSAQQFSMASFVADDIEASLQFRLQSLTKAAERVTPELLSNPAEAADFLRGRDTLNEMFQVGLVLISKEGKGIADNPYIPARRSYNKFSELEYFKKIISTGRSAVGEPGIGRVTKLPVIALAAPVKNKRGEIIAILAGYTNLSESTLFGNIENMRSGNSGYIAIENPETQVIIASSDPKRIKTLSPMAKPGVNTMVDKFVAGFDGSGIAVNSRGIETLTSAKHIASTGWIVQIVLPTSEAFAPIAAMKVAAYGFMVALSALLSILTWLVIRLAFRPLDAATHAIRQMAEGNAKLHELPASGDDEIGSLLTSFNRLVEQRHVVENAFRTSDAFANTIIDAVPQHICVISNTGKIIAVNRAWRDFYDKNHPNPAKVNYDIGTNYIDICHAAKGLGAEGAQQMGKSIINIIKKEINNFSLEYSCNSPTEGRIFVAHVTRFHGDSGNILITHENITARKYAERELERLAQTDTLTGLANRRHFMSLAEQELSRTARYGGDLSVLMMDIDHFKQVNDTYGHQTGDLVIQKLGDLCKQALRDIDIVGRIGGEEFAVILPQTGSQQAVEAAERLRTMVDTARVPMDQGMPLHFTVSIGVTSVEMTGANLDTLLGIADNAMYAAKKGGRNQVCAHLSALGI